MGVKLNSVCIQLFHCKVDNTSACRLIYLNCGDRVLNHENVFYVSIKRHYGFDALRKRGDKIVWLANKNESFGGDNKDEIVLGFLNENWDSGFVTTGHEIQSVLIETFVWNFRAVVLFTRGASIGRLIVVQRESLTFAQLLLFT